MAEDSHPLAEANASSRNPPYEDNENHDYEEVFDYDIEIEEVTVVDGDESYEEITVVEEEEDETYEFGSSTNHTNTVATLDATIGRSAEDKPNSGEKHRNYSNHSSALSSDVEEVSEVQNEVDLEELWVDEVEVEDVDPDENDEYEFYEYEYEFEEEELENEHSGERHEETVGVEAAQNGTAHRRLSGGNRSGKSDAVEPNSLHSAANDSAKSFSPEPSRSSSASPRNDASMQRGRRGRGSDNMLTKPRRMKSINEHTNNATFRESPTPSTPVPNAILQRNGRPLESNTLPSLSSVSSKSASTQARSSRQIRSGSGATAGSRKVHKPPSLSSISSQSASTSAHSSRQAGSELPSSGNQSSSEPPQTMRSQSHFQPRNRNPDRNLDPNLDPNCSQPRTNSLQNSPLRSGVRVNPSRKTLGPQHRISRHPSKPTRQRARRDPNTMRIFPASSTVTTTTSSHNDSSCERGRDNKSVEIHSKSIAVLGTMSGVGKSVVAAGICRVLSRGGTRCAPFRAQNTGNRTSPALLPDLSRRKALYESFDATMTTTKSEDDAIRRKTSSVSLAISVAPTDDQGWGQVGMAQSLQAEACQIVPRVEMNPLFFKSGRKRDRTNENESKIDEDENDVRAVFVMGKQLLRATQKTCSKRVQALRTIVLESHRSLVATTGAETIVIQGAGSCSELHLANRDIANLPLVRCLQCPWLLVASDENGGVFAQVVGTKMCLSKRDWELCVGVILNKVKGNVETVASGLKRLEQMTGKPLFVIPFLDHWSPKREFGIDVEKRLAWEKKGYDKPHNRKSERDARGKSTRTKPVVVVVTYPHSITTNNLGPLEHDGRFCVEWRRKHLPKPYPVTTTVILPDSRLTLVDLKWLHDSGWANFIREHVSAGGAVLGLCSGYQMLGWNVKGEIGTKKGIGLLPISSTVKPAECKLGNHRKGQLYPSGVLIEGYEVNCGFSKVVFSKQKKVADMYQGIAPLVAYDNGKPEGMLLGRVKGTYIHGMLRSARARLELLVPSEDRKRFRSILSERAVDATEDPLDVLANHFSTNGLDHDRLLNMIFTKDTPQ